jgi:hypothetical protein
MQYNCLDYLVKWKGSDESYNQWEVHTQVHAKPKIAQFHRKYPGTARYINAAIFDSIPFTRTSVRFLTSPLLSYSPPVHMYSLSSVPSPGITPKADDFLDVDSSEVNDFHPLSSLGPEQHWTSCGRIRTGPCDTMVPSTITWTPIYGRLGTRGLGTRRLGTRRLGT